MTDFYQAERPIVKLITDFFKDKEFEKGYELLEKSQLSTLGKLECLGNAEFYKRNFSESANYYNQILHQDFNYRLARYYYFWAGKLLAQEDYKQAIEYYQEAIDIEPDFVNAYVDLGGLMFDIGEYKLAKRCYIDALKLAPNDIEIQHNIDTVSKLIKE